MATVNPNKTEEEEEAEFLDALGGSGKKMHFGNSESINANLADAFSQKLDAAVNAEKIQALDNKETKTLSVKLMLNLTANELLRQVTGTVPFWICVGVYGIGMSTKLPMFADTPVGATSSDSWNGVLMGGLGFITTFTLLWYLGKMWGRREMAWDTFMGIQGRTQDIMLLCRSTNMAFGHQVQLWRYMSCALICAVNGTCGAKYREVEFAENMINLHHLMTPQEAQVLEVWRPGTSYASKEFCVHAMNVCNAAKNEGQISDVQESDMKAIILRFRAAIATLGDALEHEPPFSTRQMVGFVVLFYNMTYAFTRGVATFEAFATISSTTTGVETIIGDIVGDCAPLADAFAGVEGCTRTASIDIETSITTVEYNLTMLILGAFQFLIVLCCYFGLLQMCDCLRNIYGDGIMSLNVMGIVNYAITCPKKLCFFGEVYQYEPTAKRLVEDSISHEILDNMYKKGFLSKDNNETQWNLNDGSQKWRTNAMHALSEDFLHMGSAGVEKLFLSADKDGSGELDMEEVRGIFLKKDPNFPQEDLDQLIKRLDPDRSGTVSWQEFERTVCSGSVVLEFVNEFHNHEKPKMDVFVSDARKNRGSVFVAKTHVKKFANWKAKSKKTGVTD